MKRRLRNLLAAANANALAAANAPAHDADATTDRVWLDCSGGAVTIAAAAGDDSLPTFEGTAYTGGMMRPMGFYRDVYVDLSGCQVAPGQRPAHKDHDPAKVVGHMDAGQIQIGKRQIKVAGTISGTGSDATEVTANSRNGFQWRLSIGASIQRMEWVDEGESVIVNGRRTVNTGCYVIRACTIFEVSFVSLGGDDDTSVTVSATMEGDAMNFSSWLAARGRDINDLQATELAQLRAEFDRERSGATETETTTTPVGSDITASSGDTSPAATASQSLTAGTNQDDESELLAQREREANQRDADRIALEAERREICARFGNPKITVDGKEVPLLVHATAQGWSANDTELHARRNSRPTGVTVTTPSGEITPHAIEASLCMTAGVSEESCGSSYDERTMNAAMSRSLRGASLQQLFATFLQHHGCYVQAGRFGDDVIEAALRKDQELLATSSTFSLSRILENVTNKRMRAAYEAVDDVLSHFCNWSPVSDFKKVTSYQLTVAGDWAKVGADGELKHGSLKEGAYDNEAVTRGMMIGLTRKHIRNDDLRAFLTIPAGIARKSANAKQRVGFGVLKSLVAGGTFFSVANRNLISGGTSVLSISGLQLAVNMFKTRQDADGDPVAVRATKLLLPTALAVVGDDLYQKTNVDTRLDSTNKKVVAHNPHAGKYEPHDTPFLDAEYENGSDTGWYLFTDKEDIAALEGVALDGRMQPTIERGEANFNTLGMEFRAFDDWGIAGGDPQGALHATGS